MPATARAARRPTWAAVTVEAGGSLCGASAVSVVVGTLADASRGLGGRSSRYGSEPTDGWEASTHHRNRRTGRLTARGAAPRRELRGVRGRPAADVDPLREPRPDPWPRRAAPGGRAG